MGKVEIIEQQSFIDRILLAVFPRLAAQRAKHRALARAYEAASVAPRFSSWRGSNLSAKEEIRGAQTTTIQRSRDLIRNNAYAARAQQVVTSNVVGMGIRPLIRATNKSQRLEKALSEKWTEWAEETTAADFYSRSNFYGIQALVMDTVFESGECFVVRVKQENSFDGIRLAPISLKVLEPELCPLNLNETLRGGGRIDQGIEFDSMGRVVAYYFYKDHPGDRLTNPRLDETIRVEKSQVIHVFHKARAGQTRGMPWLHKVMAKLKDLDIFDDATLRKQQIAACFAAFIKDSTSDGLPLAEGSKEHQLLEKLDSGTIEILPPGKDVTFASPPSSGGEYGPFWSNQLRSVSSGLGITYESLAFDLRGVNFSSGRMGHLEMQRNISRWQHQIMIQQFCNPVWNWFKDAVNFVTPGGVDPTKSYVMWSTPAREMIDPTKEVVANERAVLSGQMTLSEIIRQRGKDPMEVFKERSEELEVMRDLGIETEKETSTPEIPSEDREPKAEEID